MYRHTCERCTCDFTFSSEESKWSKCDYDGAGERIVNCPECHYQNTATNYPYTG